MKNLLENKVLLAVLCLVVGFGAGALIFGGGDKPPDPAAHGHGQETTDASAGVWTCAMHPQIRQNEPGKCPICAMDLIPVGELGGSPDMLEMSPEAAMLANIQTTKLAPQAAKKELALTGKILENEQLISLVTARFPGRIEKLYVDFTGSEVQKGQKLASIYSPELVTAQQELLEAAKIRDEHPAIFEAARQKLAYWDLPDTQIDAILNGGKPLREVNILAPHSGVVRKRLASLGQYLSGGTPILELIDLSRVWVVFDAYEQDLPWLKTGDALKFTVGSLPGETFEAKISFVDPVVNPQTRTVAVRTEVANRGRRLKPGMFANGVLQARLPFTKPQLTVPKSAVMWTGKRSVVYVKVPDTRLPTFQFREVELGTDLGTHFLVEAGLTNGEEVVTNGAFKVDAAAQLAGKQSMMNRAQGAGGGQIGRIQTPEAFRLQLTGIYDVYLDIKNALVASDFEASKQAGKPLQSKLSAVQTDGLSTPASEAWQKMRANLEGAIQAFAGSRDLAAQRHAFRLLTDALSPAIETYGLINNKVFKDYCPMAEQNEGAFWLSEFREIKNPYFGDKMLKCGEVKSIIE